MTLDEMLEKYAPLNYHNDVVIRVECDFACTFMTLLPQSYFSLVIYVCDSFLVIVLKKRTKVDNVREVLQSVSHLVTDWAIL